MSTSFGLKLTKPRDTKSNLPSKPSSKPSAFSKHSIFGGLADDDDDDEDPTKSLNKKNGSTQYGLQKPSSLSSIPSKHSGPGSLDKPALATSEIPEEDDPSIYDYD